MRMAVERRFSGGVLGAMELRLLGRMGLMVGRVRRYSQSMIYQMKL